MNKEIETKAINSIRILSADAIQKANSGHPGLPLGAAPSAYTLWAKHLNFDPTHLDWENRDRCVRRAWFHASLFLVTPFLMRIKKRRFDVFPSDGFSYAGASGVRAYPGGRCNYRSSWCRSCHGGGLCNGRSAFGGGIQ